MNGFIKGLLGALGAFFIFLAILYFTIPQARAQTREVTSCFPKQVMGSGSLAYVHRTDASTLDDWTDSYVSSTADAGSGTDANPAQGWTKVGPWGNLQRKGGWLFGTTVDVNMAVRDGYPLPAADQWAWATLDGSTPNGGLVLRANPATNSFYAFTARHPTAGVGLWKRVNGVYSSIPSTIPIPAGTSAKPGDWIAFTVTGSTLKGFVNGVKVIEGTDTTMFDNGGAPGAWVSGTGSGFKEFEAGQLRAPTKLNNGPTWFAWWWCEKDFEQRLSLLACPEAKLSECITPAVRAAVAQPTDSILRSLWTANIKMDVTDPTLRAAFNAALPEIRKTIPAPPAYVVAKNGTSTTRPAYAYIPPATASAPATRATTSTTRATVGATCDCKKVRVIETTATGKDRVFCASNIAQTEVALCVRP